MELIPVIERNTPATSSLPPQILTRHGLQEGMTREAAMQMLERVPNYEDWLDLLNHGSACYILGKDARAEQLTLESTRVLGTAAGYINLAVIYSMQGRFIDALLAAEKAHDLEIENKTAATIYCESLLRMGKWGDAWPLFHNYYDQSRVSMFSMVIPEWSIENSLEGKRILVIEGGGFGDNFFFLRYLPRLRERGAKITYFCPESMASLMMQQSYIDSVIPTQKGRVADLRISDFDYYAPLLSLGRKFGQQAFSPTQPTPYVSATTEPKVNSIQRIGFCPVAAEAGNPRPFRSLDKTQGEAFRKAFAGREYVMLVPSDGWLENWLETARWINSCDLIVTVDTGVAHLAAAMGKPTWVILPGFSAWYYLTGVTTHPLYPNMRLFRNLGRGMNVAISECLTALNSLEAT